MNPLYIDDIIVAISTPIGRGGISIIRLSGNGCIDVVDRVFLPKTQPLSQKKSHTISYGKIIDVKTKEVIDEVLVMLMKSPNTYTKEDVVEINCHGGMLVTQKIVENILSLGVRLAQPGEFTKRAFLSGRIDLTQAEAVIDIINSKTELSRKYAVNQLSGKLKNEIHLLRDKLIDMAASIEAAIDYPEHDVEEQTYENMYKLCNEVKEEIYKLYSNADKGKILREGINTVILGKPNVGKSSLLNALLNEERAIVTDIPGTTRDTVEEYINIEGIPIRIIDTAGIRQASDDVEKIGVEKSKEYALKADLILMLLDISRPLDDDDIEILQIINDKKYIIILNKTDLQQKLDINEIEKYVKKDEIINISITENIGIEKLTNKIKNLFFGGDINFDNDIVAGNARHKISLYKAYESIERALNTIKIRMPEDFISMDIQDALKYLGEITGDTIDDEIIDRVFSKFCLGK